MAHQIDMVMDFQFGSTGKGLIAGYLAKRNPYDTVVCSFATNAGHTYIDKDRGMCVMTQQLPTAAIACPTVKNILIGPGALIHPATLQHEIDEYHPWLKGKSILIHPHAAVVEDYHADQEMSGGMTKIGSTAKGVGAAMIERIKRDPVDPNVAANRFAGTDLFKYVVSAQDYRDAIGQAEYAMIEGAQGFGLSMYHGFYPYTTSRDVTPWQIAADCALPYKWASYIRVIGTARTFPIRVNNRDGSSGPGYSDQTELDWSVFKARGIEPELTTVTKLPRRIFTFSRQQMMEAAFHCGGYWDTRVFLNFCNYINSSGELNQIISQIEQPCGMVMNPPRVQWLGWGPDDGNVVARG